MCVNEVWHAKVCFLSLVTINFVFGVALLGVGAFAFQNGTDMVSDSSNSETPDFVRYPAIGVMVLGIVVMIFSGIGIFGGVKDNKKLLSILSCATFILVLLEIALAIIALLLANPSWTGDWLGKQIDNWYNGLSEAEKEKVPSPASIEKAVEDNLDFLGIGATICAVLQIVTIRYASKAKRKIDTYSELSSLTKFKPHEFARGNIELGGGDEDL